MTGPAKGKSVLVGRLQVFIRVPFIRVPSEFLEVDFKGIMNVSSNILAKN